MQTSRHMGLTYWAMVILLIAAFATRVFSLTSQSLWRDEVDALRFATAPWRELLNTFTRAGWNGPLYFALLRGWIALTGRSEFALRYFSLLFGVLAVALAFVLSKRLSKPLAALVCSLLFALSPYFVWYSQEVKMYTLILALATLAVYALRRAMRAEGTRGTVWWVTFVAATSIAMYCHILAALLIPVEMILAFVWSRGTRANGWWKGTLVSFACLTLPYLPLLRWQLPLVLTPAQTGFTFYPFDQMLQIMLNGFSTGISGKLTEIMYNLAVQISNQLTAAKLNSIAAKSALLTTTPLWPTTILLITGAVVGPAQWRDKVMLVVWLLLPPLALYLVSLNRPIFTDRYLIWIGPAFYLLVALGTAAIWRFWRPLGVASVITIAGISIAGVYYQAAIPIKSDFRDAAHFFAQHSVPGDLVIFQIPYVRYTFDYYYPQPYDWAEGLFTNYGMSDAEVDSQMRKIVAGRKTVWLVASEMTMWDSRLQVWKWLESHARRTNLAEFAQVIVYRYELGER